MFDLSNPRTWQDITNWILVLVALTAAIYIGIGAYREARRKARRVVPVRPVTDTHTYILPDLGITMADGGEEIGKKEKDETAS